MNFHSFIDLRFDSPMADRKLRKEQLTEQREGEILKAALEVFTRKGYGAASIPEIAGLAGVSVGTIYNYYTGKRELFIAVMKNLIITGPFLDITVNVPDPDIANMFKQIIQDRLKLTETEPGSRIPYLSSEIVREPELKELWVQQYIQPFFTQMEATYSAMVDSGRLRPTDAPIAVRAVAGLVIGFNILKFLEGENSPAVKKSQETIADTLTNLVLHGLAEDTHNNDS